MTNLILVLRSIIGDLDSSLYADSRLEQILTVAALHVYTSATFSTVYTIDILAKTISPDPFTAPDRDFIMLVCYKAACMIATFEIKTESSISMRDGPSSIDNSGTAKNLKEAQKSYCEIYETMLSNYLLDGGVFGSGGNGQAILGPYSPGSDLVTQFGLSTRERGWQ